MGLFQRPIQEDLGWSSTSIAIGFALGSGMGGLGSIFVGRILDKRGSRGVAVVSGMILTGCMLGLASMTQVWHFWGLFGLARGTAAAGAQLGTMVALASWFVRKRGRVVGLLGVAQRTGQAIMPIPIAAVMLALGWREAWVALAGFAFLAILLPSGILLRRRPEDYGLLPDGRTAPEDIGLQGEVSEVAGEELWTLREAKRTRTLWLLIVGQGAVILAVNATNLHIAASLQDNGLSQSLAVTTITIFLTVAALSVFAWGLIMERVHTRFLGMTATGLYFIAMVLAANVDSFLVALVFSITFGSALGVWTVVSRMLFANYFGRRSFGTIRGFAAPIMSGVSMAGPIFAGVIRDVTGSYDQAFLVFAGVFVIGFLGFALATPVYKTESTDAVSGTP
jgi:sugar phosphate permease